MHKSFYPIRISSSLKYALLFITSCCCCQDASVVSDSTRPHGLQPTGLLCPWDSPGKNTGVGCHFLLQCMKVKSESEITQSYLTLSDPMDCSLPGSSIHGVFQARVLESGATAFSDDLMSLTWFNRALTYWTKHTFKGNRALSNPTFSFSAQTTGK